MRRRTVLGAITAGMITVSGCITRVSSKRKKTFTVINKLNETGDITISIKRSRFLRGETTINETESTMKKDTEYEDHVPIGEKTGEYIAEVTIEDRGTVTEEFDYGGPVTSPHLYISEENQYDNSFSISIDMAPDA